MRFLADEMLNKTARWLRLIGFDTEHASGISDDKILEKAVMEGRVLLTRDEELAGRAAKIGADALYLKQGSVEDDLRAVLSTYGLSPGFPEKTRCPECNGGLSPKKVEDVEKEIPAGSRESGSSFWKCSSCGKVYWEGAHWKNIKKVLEKIEKN